MNLLKGITEELKGTGDRTQANDRSRSRTTPERNDASSTAPTAAEPDATGERTRDDEHVCAFCATAFAANRGACPDCGAEIVLRGARSN